MKILAIDDGGFPEGVPGKRRGKALLLGVVISDSKVEQTLLSSINVDGLDATERLMEIVEGGGELIDLIMLPSISCGGFNLIDPIKAYDRLRIPIIIVNPKEPNDDAVERALIRHFPNWEERLRIIRRIGHPKRLVLEGGKPLYFHAIGLPEASARKLIREAIRFGNRPEPLRIAHILAHDLSRKEMG